MTRARAAGLILSLRAPRVPGPVGTEHRPGPERPELYDFSLFEKMERQVGPADREHRLDELTFVVFDTETTGLRPEAGDRIVSLAGVRVRGGTVRRHETFDTLVDPGRGVPPESVRFHGITDEMFAGAPPLDAVLPGVPRICRAGRAGRARGRRSTCGSWSRRRGGWACRPRRDPPHPGHAAPVPEPSRPRGDHTRSRPLRCRLGVAMTGRHSALGDALITAEILVRLLALIQKRGSPRRPAGSSRRGPKRSPGHRLDLARPARPRPPRIDIPTDEFSQWVPGILPQRSPRHRSLSNEYWGFSAVSSMQRPGTGLAASCAQPGGRVESIRRPGGDDGRDQEAPGARTQPHHAAHPAHGWGQ